MRNSIMEQFFRFLPSRGHWLHTACAVCLSCLLLFSQGDAALPEYEVKAAIIYKVSKFVTWPASQDINRPFNLCVLGSDPFQTSIDNLNGQVLRGQKIVVQRLAELSPSAANCDLAFISASSSKRMPAILAALKGHAILTISDMPDFAHNGGMFGLVTRDNKIVFEINIGNTRAAGIDISSQLLQLATIVDGKGAK